MHPTLPGVWRRGVCCRRAHLENSTAPAPQLTGSLYAYAPPEAGAIAWRQKQGFIAPKPPRFSAFTKSTKENKNDTIHPMVHRHPDAAGNPRHWRWNIVDNALTL